MDEQLPKCCDCGKKELVHQGERYDVMIARDVPWYKCKSCGAEYESHIWYGGSGSWYLTKRQDSGN
jgi:DNA-directed RNA polymerase subunit RPC12/RpoP